MTNISPVGCTLSDVVDDPLIRLVMASDGVSERDLVGLMVRVRRAIRTQEGDARRAAVAPRAA